MSDQLEVLLYGLGALLGFPGRIGSFYAFILSRSKRVRLTVVARSNYEAIKKNGLTIKSQNHGEHFVTPANVVRTPEEAGQTFDYVVCANKAINQDQVPKQLASTVDENKTCIVIIQNGVGNEDPFREAFPNAAILTCVTWVGALQVSPGIVEHTKSEGTQIGVFPNPALDEGFEQSKLNEFTNFLQEGQTPFTVEPNMQIQRWEKVVWNTAWNSLTTLARIDTRSWLTSSPEAIPLTRRLMQEVADVARKCGVPLHAKLVDKFLDDIQGMPPIWSSMYQDCVNGRPMEVDIILGTPVRKGRELGVPIPTLEVIYAILLGANSKAG